MMGNTGDRCNDLYEAAKQMKNYQKREDRSREDCEFEKNKEHCTFVPEFAVNNMNQTINTNKSSSFANKKLIEQIK